MYSSQAWNNVLLYKSVIEIGGYFTQHCVCWMLSLQGNGSADTRADEDNGQCRRSGTKMCPRVLFLFLNTGLENGDISSSFVFFLVLIYFILSFYGAVLMQ